MLRMPDPIYPDLPCLFACAALPTFCGAAISIACSKREGIGLWGWLWWGQAGCFESTAESQPTQGLGV